MRVITHFFPQKQGRMLAAQEVDYLAVIFLELGLVGLGVADAFWDRNHAALGAGTPRHPSRPYRDPIPELVKIIEPLLLIEHRRQNLEMPALERA